MNPYEVLGLERGATPDAIKAAYRAQAKVHHPDVPGGSREAFQRVQDAYEALANPQPQQRGGFHGHSFNDFGFGDGEFETVFAEMFRRSQHARRFNPAKEIVLEVTLEQVLNGCEYDVTIEDLPNHPVYRVKIPIGVQHGQRIRIPESGPRPFADLPPGDLILIVAVRNHSRFRRHANHVLTTDVEIDSLEAILGTTVQITGLGGDAIEITIPAGSQFADRIMVPGQGLSDGQARAPLYVNIGVKTPTTLTEKHIEMVQRLSEMLPKTDRLE